jgi:hypothetical protein
VQDSNEKLREGAQALSKRTERRAQSPISEKERGGKSENSGSDVTNRVNAAKRAATLQPSLADPLVGINP